MRRSPNQVLPLEHDILSIASDLIYRSMGTSSDEADGAGWFHAYAIAQLLAERHGKNVLSHGTLYRSLHGMSEPGRRWLDRRLESPEEARSHPGRPRCYYRLTAAGSAAFAAVYTPLVIPEGSPAFRFNT